MSHENDPPVIGNTDDTVEVTVPKGFIVADGNMEPEIVSLAAPEADPQQFAMDATGPIQTWTNEHVILPNIGDVDAKLLGLGGLSNTIVVSTTTAEVLATITVSIGPNGNWFVGNVDTGVPASGTDPESILRMVGAYIQAPVSYDVPTATMTISVGGHYVAYNGIAEGYVQFQVTGIITDVIAASTKVVSMDSTGVTYQHTDPDLLLIPESQVILATFEGSGPARVMTVFPTVHEMVYGLQGVVSEIDGKVAEAEAWAIAAANSAAAAANSAAAAAADAAQTAADRVQTAADRVQTGQDAVTTAADRVQTGLDAAATAADRAATSADVVSTNADAAATAADRVQTGLDAASSLDSKNLAREYAVNPEDVPITGAPTDYSAYHWAEKAKASAESVVSGVHYQGQWDASLGAFPTPPPGPVDVVDYYRISAAGTMTGTGSQHPVTTAVGDSLYWDPVGLVWYEQESGDSVRTINGTLPDSFGNINVTTGGIGAVDLTSAQTIGGKKTFSVVPASTAPAAAASDLMRKGEVDAGFVSKTGATGAAQLPVGTTAQRPPGAEGLVRFNGEIKEYEGWNGTDWAPLGGGAGVPDPVIHTADFTIQLEKGNWCDLTNVSGMTGTVPAGMEIGDWFAIGDAYGLCSVSKPITIPACIWNGTALEDLVITTANANITLQDIDGQGGLKIIDGSVESNLPYEEVVLWTGRAAPSDGTTADYSGTGYTIDDFEKLIFVGDVQNSSAVGPIRREYSPEDFNTSGLATDRVSFYDSVSPLNSSNSVAVGINKASDTQFTFPATQRGTGITCVITKIIGYTKYKSSRPAGVEGSFTSADGKTITVTAGIITAIV